MQQQTKTILLVINRWKTTRQTAKAAHIGRHTGTQNSKAKTQN